MVEEVAKLGADVAGLSRAIPIVDVVTRLWYLASPIPLVLEEVPEGLGIVDGARESQSHAAKGDGLN